MPESGERDGSPGGSNKPRGDQESKDARKSHDFSEEEGREAGRKRFQLDHRDNQEDKEKLEDVGRRQTFKKGEGGRERRRGVKSEDSIKGKSTGKGGTPPYVGALTGHRRPFGVTEGTEEGLDEEKNNLARRSSIDCLGPERKKQLQPQKPGKGKIKMKLRNRS